MTFILFLLAAVRWSEYVVDRPPPEKKSRSFIQNLLDNCKFHIIKDERLVSKMERKTNFSRRLKQFDGLT